MKRITTLFIALCSVSATFAQIPTTLPTDTLARDLTDLEEKMVAADITTQSDTAYYGFKKQQSFNALDYSLDKRHRYAGDKWARGHFGKHTFFQFGANAIMYQHNNDYELTTQAGLHFKVGKDLSPMSSLRIGVGGELGYITSKPNVSWTMRADADYLFNFSNYLLGYRPDRPLSVSGILGFGIQQSHLTKYAGSEIVNAMKEKAFSFNLHTGLQFKFHAGAHAAVAIEPYIMAGTEGMDLAKASKFNHFGIGYGVNLSYIWYFYNNMSAENNAGDFKKRFDSHNRLFLNDPNKASWRRPWFFQYSIGPAYWQRTPLKTSETLGYSISASLGQWLSSAIGVRGGVVISNAPWTKSEETISLLGKSGIFFDAMVNPFGFTRYYNWDTPFGINFFGGYEMGQLQMVHADIDEKTSGKYAGYRLGTQLWAKLTNDLRLTFEPSYIFTEHFDRNDGRVRYDQMDYKLGLTMLFRGKSHRNYDMLPAKNDLPEYGFFMGGGFGWNTTVSKWRYAEKKRGLLLNANAFIGYNFNMYHGAKIMMDYVANPIWQRSGNHDFDKFTYKNTFISADYQFNLLNAMAGYKPGRRWGVNIYAGPSLVLSKTGKKIDLGGNFGGMLSYRVLPYLSLFYSHTVYWMPAEHYNSAQIYTTPGAVSNVLTFGALYHLDGFFKTIKNLPWKNAPSAGQSRFFLDYGYGYALYPMLPSKAKDSWGTTMQLSLGWWLNSFLGARVGLNMAKGIDMTTTYTENNRTEDVHHAIGLGSIAGDILLNPFGLNKNYNWKSLVGANLLMGYQNGWLVMNDAEHTIKGSKITVSGFRLGLQLWTRLSRDLRFTIEPMYSTLNAHNNIYISEDGKNLYRTAENTATPLRLGNTFSVRFGLSVPLNRIGRHEDADMTSFASKNPQRFFAGIGGGWNILLTKHRLANDGAKINFTAFAGYRLNEVSALRLGANYIMDNNKYAYIEKDKAYFEEDKKNIAFIAADFQLDLLAYFRGYNPKRQWNVNLYVGPAIAIETSKDHNKDGAINLGLTAKHQLSRNFSLFYNHDIYLMGFLGQPTLLPGTNLVGNVTALNCINFGLMYNFNLPLF